MSSMFYGCTSFNQPLNSWDVSEVTNMYDMFSGCATFNQNLGMWKLKKCKKLGLGNCGMSIENYSKSLIGWAAQTNINRELALNATGLKYSAEAKSAREKLINSIKWEIRGDEFITIPVTRVTLSETELPLLIGATETLTATVVPSDATNQKVTWSSNNTAVAIVENGTVTAVFGGTATITVTTEDGNHTATCEVTVTVPVTGVMLSQTELPLVKGATATLTATVAPSDATNKKVTWSSNNTAVAIVENGTVTAVSGGNATITVTTEDGNHTATCEVTVAVSATGVTLSQTELSLVKGATATLRATVVPSDATNQKVTWHSNNTSVATVENGTVTAVSGGGNATITVTTEDGNHTATCEVTVEATSAVEDVVFASVVVSPNPFGAQLCITNSDLRGQYALYNAHGVVVASGVLEDGETRINTVLFTAGVYLLRLTAENGATKNYTVVKD